MRTEPCHGAVHKVCSSQGWAPQGFVLVFPVWMFCVVLCVYVFVRCVHVFGGFGWVSLIARVLYTFFPVQNAVVSGYIVADFMHLINGHINVKFAPTFLLM